MAGSINFLNNLMKKISTEVDSLQLLWQVWR